MITTRIVGNHFTGRDGHVAMNELRRDDPVILEPDPKNPVDPDAIAVKTKAGVRIGFVPRTDTGVIHKQLALGAKTVARYTGHGRERTIEVRFAAGERG